MNTPNHTLALTAIRFLLATGGIILLTRSVWAQLASTPDPRFWQPDGPVNALFEKNRIVYLGGAFTYLGPFTGGVGAIDLTTGQGNRAFPKTDGAVFAVASDGNGGWYVGGSFSQVGGVPRNNLAHILSGNTVDKGWKPSADQDVLAIAVSGNLVYVGGEFQNIDGQRRNRIAALDKTNGQISPWNPSALQVVNALAISGDLVYVGGNFTSIGGQIRNRIAALNANDTTNYVTSWNPNANRIVHALAVDGNQIYVGGDFTTIGAKPRNRAAALDAETGEASNWSPNANAIVRAFAFGTNLVYVGGDFVSIGGRTRNHIAALDAVLGQADPNWDPNANGNVFALTVLGSTLYAGGQFTTVGGQTHRNLAALVAATGAATAWDPQASSLNASRVSSVRVVALDGNSAFVGGDFLSIGGITRNRIAAVDALTGEPTGWDPNADFTVKALAISGNAVYAGGNFTNIGGAARHWIAALDSSTGQATEWNPRAAGGSLANAGVSAIAASRDAIYLGGTFNNVGGQTRNNLAAVDSASGLATGWNPNAGGAVHTLLLSTNVVYVGGDFTAVGGVPRNRIAALNLTTGQLDPWNPNASSTVRTLFAASNTIYVGGSFGLIGGQLRNRIAALDSVSGQATVWDPGTAGTGQFAVFALARLGSVICAGGSFTTLDGEFSNRLGALDTLTSLATSWNPNADQTVRALAFSQDAIYAGGDFTALAGQPNAYFAAFSNQPGFDSSSLQRLADGSLKFRLTDGGVSGNTLLIQVSGDLANWVTLSTNVVTGNPIDFTDTQGASFQPRFYRAVVQPAP